MGFDEGFGDIGDGEEGWILIEFMEFEDLAKLLFMLCWFMVFLHVLLEEIGGLPFWFFYGLVDQLMFGEVTGGVLAIEGILDEDDNGRGDLAEWAWFFFGSLF